MMDQTSQPENTKGEMNLQNGSEILIPVFLQDKGAEEDEIKSTPMWLLTFSDVTALMLTFFVLLYSMATPDADKWEEIADTFNAGLERFNVEQFEAGAQDTIAIEKLELKRALPLDYLRFVISEVAEQNEARPRRSIPNIRE